MLRLPHGVRRPSSPRVVGHRFDQVADVVQQGGDDERLRRPAELRKVRRLQAVLGHGDALAEIGGRAARLVDRKDSAVRLMDAISGGLAPQQRRGTVDAVTGEVAALQMPRLLRRGEGGTAVQHALIVEHDDYAVARAACAAETGDRAATPRSADRRRRTAGVAGGDIAGVRWSGCCSEPPSTSPRAES